MSSVVAPLAIPATLQLPDGDLDVTLEVDYVKSSEGVTVGAVGITLSDDDRTKIASLIGTLYEDNGDAQE